MKQKTKQTSNVMRGEFEASRLEQLAQQLEWREWTRTLLTQRLATLDSKLAAGDMPVLDGVTEPSRSGVTEPSRSAVTESDRREERGLSQTGISAMDGFSHPNESPNGALSTVTEDDLPEENFAEFIEA